MLRSVCVLLALMATQVVSPHPEAAPDAVYGSATWYCNADPGRGPVSRCTRGHPDGGGEQLYAAIRRDLLHLRGDRISVCITGTTQCVRVTVIDCQCGGSTLVDLYADAFERLGAPLSRGRLNVTIAEARGPIPTVPPTDTEP